MAVLNLPYPVSANRYWRRSGRFTHVSAEAKAYKRAVALAALYAKLTVLDGPVRVSIALQPKLTLKGKANRTRIDLDNCIKVTLDALNGVAYLDDSQVVAITAHIASPVACGGLMVIVERVVRRDSAKTEPAAS
jgi:crossover junction endodeoxyribonuclease RusA